MVGGWERGISGKVNFNSIVEPVHRGDLVQGREEDCAALWNDAGDEANLCAQEKQAVSLRVHSLFIFSWNVSCVLALVEALKAFCKFPL